VARSRRPFVTLLSIGLAAAALTVQPTAEAAAPMAPTPDAKPAVSGTTFAVDGEPQRITMGPDGNLWFGVVNNSGTNDLARITPAGAITYFQLGAVNIGTLVIGPDGGLWATTATGVAKIPTADPTALTPFTIPGFANGEGLAVGPDNNLWAAAADKLYRVPIAAPTTATPVNILGSQLKQVTATSDRVWVADANGNVHAVTTGGDVTTTVTGGQPQGIVAGPDGQVFYTVPDGADTFVGRQTLGGQIQKTPFPNTDPSFGVAFGPDNNYWFGLLVSREAFGLSPTGEVTSAGIFPAPYGARYVANGPDATMWMSLQDPGNDGAIGVVTGLDVDKTAIITIKGGKAKVKNRKAKVKLQCPAEEISGPCTGEVKLKALTGTKQKLGSKTYSIVTGANGTVKVKLGRATVAGIGPKGLKVKAIVTVTDALGNKAKVVEKIKLVR
jgi:streptogramin lyase